MIIQCTNLSKAFGDNRVIKGATFALGEKEKAAIVGINGAGKSTLLKMIIGDLSPDGGEVSVSKGATVGYLAQHDAVLGEHTIYEEVMEAGADLTAMREELRSLR